MFFWTESVFSILKKYILDSAWEHASPSRPTSRFPPGGGRPPNPIVSSSPNQTLAHRQAPEAMVVAAPGQINIDGSPTWGSRGIDCFEKLEQIGEGTYGYARLSKLPSSPPNSTITAPAHRPIPGAPSLTRFSCDCYQASVHGEGEGDEGNRGAQEDPHGQRARGSKYFPSCFRGLRFEIRIGSRLSPLLNPAPVPYHSHPRD